MSRKNSFANKAIRRAQRETHAAYMKKKRLQEKVTILDYMYQRNKEFEAMMKEAENDK